jgi:hypothetical protein
MADKELRQVVNELIAVLHEQAKELELLVAHVEQVTRRLPKDHEFSVIASELSELHYRSKKLTALQKRVPARGLRRTKKKS